MCVPSSAPRQSLNHFHLETTGCSADGLGSLINS
uniref:Uncharacterized protein n=1 Tax=Arundo donax TaxID=35708 RepID=A0A0A8YYE3_ARUDO